MPWTLTRSLDTFAGTAGDLLRAEPVRHTVPLTLLATLRASGPSTFGDHPPRYGWHVSAGGLIDGAVMQTPPFPVLVAALPAGSAADLIGLLSADGGLPAAANVTGDDAAAFSAAWAVATRGSTTVAQRQRLFRLDRLVPPDPAPPGAARVADGNDRELLVAWHEAFGREAHAAGPEHADRTVDDRLSHRGVTLWEAGGQPVAMAERTREVAGVARIAGVYTAPAHRQRGYGGAVTAAVTQSALEPVRLRLCFSPTWPTRPATRCTSGWATARSVIESCWTCIRLAEAQNRTHIWDLAVRSNAWTEHSRHPCWI